jgi:hypothetical protein
MKIVFTLNLVNLTKQVMYETHDLFNKTSHV